MYLVIISTYDAELTISDLFHGLQAYYLAIDKKMTEEDSKALEEFILDILTTEETYEANKQYDEDDGEDYYDLKPILKDIIEYLTAKGYSVINFQKEGDEDCIKSYYYNIPESEILSKNLR